MSPKFEHPVHGVPAEFMGISVYDPHHWSQVFTKYLYEYIQNSSIWNMKNTKQETIKYSQYFIEGKFIWFVTSIIRYVIEHS